MNLENFFKENKQDSLKIIITVVLVIVFFVVLFSRGCQKTPVHGRYAEKSYKGDSLQEVSLLSLYAKLDTEGQLIQLKRDPFSGVMINQDLDSMAKPVLNGVIWSQDSALAILNGNIVRQGDKVGSYLVVKIRENSVVITDGQEAFELRLVH